MAGNWLFSGRRWRNPRNPQDRAALIAGYDSLVATFPDFARCSRDRFLATISSFWSSWSRSTRHDLSDPPESTPAPTDDEWPSPRGGGSTGLGLESGAADLQAQRRGTRGREHTRGTDYPQHSGVGPIALLSSQAGGKSEPAVSCFRLQSILPKRFSRSCCSTTLTTLIVPPASTQAHYIA
jgi:hypothetical protein